MPILDGDHWNVDLGRVAHTLTKALDYVGIDDRSHGRRVGLMCHRAAHRLGWKRERRHAILIAGMIHDCGVSSTATHQKLVDEMEWSGAEDHCRRGEALLRGFAPFAGYGGLIRHHHSRWTALPAGLDPWTAQGANLVFLMDRFDVVRAQFLATHDSHEVLHARAHLADRLRPHVGSLFAPHLFAALEQAIRHDSFWIELEDEFLDPAIFEALSTANHHVRLDFDHIFALGEMMSHIVDAKSPFTHAHSLRVADLAQALAGLLDLPTRQGHMLRLAGLLHDVGKLRTPDDILEKAGPLSEGERDRMTRHPLDSKLVLTALFPHAPMHRWAAQHHEKLNGTGYPFGWQGEQIEPETRILTICDIFQALCQVRPYRGRLPVEEVIAIMTKMEAGGEIDPDIFAVVCRHRQPLYAIAIGGE